MNTSNQIAELHTVHIESLAFRCLPLYEETSEEQTSPIYAELRELKSLSERYRDPVEIARGGMKSIKKVYDVATCHDVAMAELHEGIDQAFHEVFLREARLTALLDHPNIMSVHEIGLKPSGDPYFIMDLKPGHSLEDILKEIREGNRLYSQPFDMETRLQIFNKVCDAVEYAHANHVIHLDLKPANIQVGKFGEVLLCDWGLAKILDLTQTRTHMDLVYDDADLDEMLLNHDILNHMTFTTEIKGTPGYMSPEQIDLNGTKDKASDIYALGAILYSLFKFTPPVEGEIKDVLRKTATGELKSFDDLPGSIAAIIRRAMAMEKSDRYESVTELKADVHKYLAGFATSAESTNPIKELSLFFNRNKAASLIALLAMILLAAISSGFIIHLQQKNRDVTQKRDEAIKAQNLAEKHRIEAEKSQETAELLAEKFKQEKMHLEKMTDQLTQVYLDDSVSMHNGFIFQMPIKAMNHSIDSMKHLLAIKPDNLQAIDHLIYAYFISQDFDQITKLNAKGTGEYRNLVTLASRYQTLSKLKEKNILHLHHFKKLMNELSKMPYRQFLLSKMLIYDQGKRNVWQGDRLGPVKVIIANWNPDWKSKPGDLTYDSESSRVEINTADIRKLSIEVNTHRHCPLHYLSPHSLKLGGGGTYDLKHVRGLEVTELDISEASELINPGSITWFFRLKRLILRSDQIGEDKITLQQIKQMKSRAKVIIK